MSTLPKEEKTYCPHCGQELPPYLWPTNTSANIKCPHCGEILDATVVTETTGE